MEEPFQPYSESSLRNFREDKEVKEKFIFIL